MDTRISLPFRVHISNTLYPHEEDCEDWIEDKFKLGEELLGYTKIPRLCWGYYEWCKLEDPKYPIDKIIKERYAAKNDDEDLSQFLYRIIGAVMIARTKYHHIQPEWVVIKDREINYNWAYNPSIFDGDAHEIESRQIKLYSVQNNDIENAVPIVNTVTLPRFHWAYYDWLLKNDDRGVQRYIIEESERRYDLNISENYEWCLMCIFLDRAEKKLSQPEWIIVE